MSQPAMAPQGPEACGTTFCTTIERLLFLCGAAHVSAEIEEVVGAPRARLVELDHGVYFGVAAFLDVDSLGPLDAACRRLRELDRALGGPWYQMGLSVYGGLELHGVGTFDPSGMGTLAPGGSVTTGCQLARLDWKRRYGRFRAEVPTFQAPFSGSIITEVQDGVEFNIVIDNTVGQTLGLDVDFSDGVSLNIDAVTGGLALEWNQNHPELAVKPRDRIVEVNGIRNGAGQLVEECRQHKVLEMVVKRGQVALGRCPLLVWSYFEVEVLANPGHVSLCVQIQGPVYLEWAPSLVGAPTALTLSGLYIDFDPLLGLVHLSCGSLSMTRRVLSALTATTPGRGFEGSIGLLVRKGDLAFFRRHAARAGEGEELEVGPWDSIEWGDCLSWAKGSRLTPCLSFGERGPYHVQMTCLNSPPPVMP
jgi:hypothetical protein